MNKLSICLVIILFTSIGLFAEGAQSTGFDGKTLLSIAMSAGALLISILVAFLMKKQLKEFQKALHGDTIAKLQNHGLEILKLLGKNKGSFYKYFYEGKKIVSHKNKIKVNLLAEEMADFFEHIISQKRAVKKSSLFIEYRKYMQYIYKNSPILEEFIKTHESWFSDDLRENLLEKENLEKEKIGFFCKFVYRFCRRRKNN